MIYKVNFTKFHNCLAKSVNFLLLAWFWACSNLHQSLQRHKRYIRKSRCVSIHKSCLSLVKHFCYISYRGVRTRTFRPLTPMLQFETLSHMTPNFMVMQVVWSLSFLHTEIGFLCSTPWKSSWYYRIIF